MFYDNDEIFNFKFPFLKMIEKNKRLRYMIYA